MAKIIQVMKLNKDLDAKAADLREKVHKHCADLDFETPVYGDPAAQRKIIDGWLQAHGDILQEIAKNRVDIQRTNLATNVTIELDGKPVTKTIAEWIHRRRDLSELDLQMWRGLGSKERGLNEGPVKTSSGEIKDVKIRRYYDPTLRDHMAEIFRSEKSIIDATLETVNAVTDVIESQVAVTA